MTPQVVRWCTVQRHWYDCINASWLVLLQVVLVVFLIVLSRSVPGYPGIGYLDRHTLGTRVPG
eukprot:175904-Rhodomonas_salina.6